MKISVYATTALAAATSFSCFVSATTAAVSRNRKIQKKNSSSSGATTGTSDGGPVPQDTECPCTTTSDCDWALPTYSGVCVDNYCQFTYNPDWTFPLGGYCGYTILNHCAIPTGLTHGVCREGIVKPAPPARVAASPATVWSKLHWHHLMRFVVMGSANVVSVVIIVVKIMTVFQECTVPMVPKNVCLPPIAPVMILTTARHK